MLNMKSVASALVLVASAADLAAPVLVAPAIVLAASTFAHAQGPAQSAYNLAANQLTIRQQASQPVHAG
jgi:hypothetical protein